LVDAAYQEKRVLQEVLVSLKKANAQDRNTILDSILVQNGLVQLPDYLAVPSPTDESPIMSTATHPPSSNNVSQHDHDHDHDHNKSVTTDEKRFTAFLSRDEGGVVRIFGPTSNLHVESPCHSVADSTQSPGSAAEPDHYQLIANAALQRQKEHDLLRLDTIGGIPSELAMHLLDLHWNRQHHTFHLTYRPAFMRDLVQGGPYCSEFLLNAVFGCSSKFSERIEVREDPLRPETAGKQFFTRCDELLAQQSLLESSSIPTIIGLIMLGATFNAQGRTSKGWLYLGYALRMVYDLGLHLDCKEVSGNAEDVEIRRRVFWAAFISDKLQSLYFGRPFMIQLRDAHVSWELMDTFEENELWTPYVDPKTIDSQKSWKQHGNIRLYSITTFQHLCSLSRIMTSIIDHFYFVGATPENTRNYLELMDEKLITWYKSMPSELRFEPWTSEPPDGFHVAAPNTIILLTIYHSLLILLHRPFIVNGHLWSADASSTHSWERCVTAARNITSLALAYQSVYPLRRANYMLSYALYVACTIHARNPAVRESTRRGDLSSPLTVCLRYLDELAVPNCGVSAPARIIRRLMEANGIPDLSGINSELSSLLSHF
jgi:hypothetical protein